MLGERTDVRTRSNRTRCDHAEVRRAIGDSIQRTELDRGAAVGEAARRRRLVQKRSLNQKWFGFTGTNFTSSWEDF